jgi:hypothetical protein
MLSLIHISVCPNVALSGAPEGHPSPVPVSPRSVAEGGTSYSTVSVYLLNPLGRKVGANP